MNGDGKEKNNNSGDSSEVVELITKLQEDPNNNRAFNELMKLYEKRVHTLVFGMTGNAHDTEDIKQDIWLQVFRCIKRYRHECTFYTWLHKVSKNRALHALNKKRKYIGVPVDEFVDESVPRELTVFRNIPQDIDRAELMRKVEAYLSTCKPQHQETFRLLMQGYPQKEIAIQLDERPGTVRTRIHYLRRQLQNLLGDEEI